MSSRDEKYDEVSLFIDESGRQTDTEDVNIVGGIMVFGEYTQSLDDLLKCILKKLLSDFNGSYPQDLHSFGSNMSGKDRYRFAKALRDNIKSELVKRGCSVTLAGAHIIHESDIGSESKSRLLIESRMDNRYIKMLWRLIEYIAVASEEVRGLAKDDALLNVYLANRCFVFERSRTLKQRLNRIGYRVDYDRNDDRNMIVARIINPTDIVLSYRIARDEIWDDTGLRLKGVKVLSIDYDKPKVMAGYYLADLYLGEIRRRITRNRPSKPLADSLIELEYGEELAHLINFNIGRRTGKAQEVFEKAVRLRMASKETTKYQKKIQESLRKLDIGTNPMAIAHKAAKQVENPSTAREGAVRAELAMDILPDDDKNVLARALLVQAMLSYANHSGDIESADQSWKQYLKLEKKIQRQGIEGLKLRAEIRNRRAVSLSDRFDYEGAAEVIEELLKPLEDLHRNLGGGDGDTDDGLPMYELGACYGTLGQVYALSGMEGWRDRARDCFSKAMALFDNPDDIERQYNYLGHLACEIGDEAADLWEEVCLAIPELKSTEPITGSGNQFKLALQIKGRLVFGERKDQTAFAEVLGSEDFEDGYTDSEMDRHPFGLIFQDAAMLYADLWRETGGLEHYNKAQFFFKRAIRRFSREHILEKLVGLIAVLRKLVLEVEIGDTSVKKAISRNLSIIVGLLSEDPFWPHCWQQREDGSVEGIFGTHDPGPDADPVERARGLMKALRFNFW